MSSECIQRFTFLKPTNEIPKSHCKSSMTEHCILIRSRFWMCHVIITHHANKQRPLWFEWFDDIFRRNNLISQTDFLLVHFLMKESSLFAFRETHDEKCKMIEISKKKIYEKSFTSFRFEWLNIVASVDHIFDRGLCFHYNFVN